MIERLAALIFLGALSQTIDVPHQIPLTVAEAGDNLTMTCPISGDKAGLFYWHRLKVGQSFQTVAAGTLYKIEVDGQFKNSNFKVLKGKTEYYLIITNVSKEDEAIYMCQEGTAYAMKFTNGTHLVVNECKNQENSVDVKQSPKTTSVQAGDSVTFQCSFLFKKKAVQCPDEDSVYWFRAGRRESHPSIIYRARHSSDEEEQRSCAYSLSKTIKDSSDKGTYYCAVVTCGEILFGEGTKVETRQELCPLVIVMGTLLCCCLIVIIALIISRNQKPVCEHCKEEVTDSHARNVRSAEEQPHTVDGEMVELNYAALNFKKRERWMSNRELPQDCMYAGIRDNQ